MALNATGLLRRHADQAYEQKGDFVSAIATIEKIPQATTDPLTLSTVGYVYAKSGERHKALEILNEFVKRSNQEYDSEVDETIAGNVRPALCRQRSPTDADHDRQFDSEKGTALPIPTAPDATECARAGPFASVRRQNYRC